MSGNTYHTLWCAAKSLNDTTVHSHSREFTALEGIIITLRTGYATSTSQKNKVIYTERVGVNGDVDSRMAFFCDGLVGLFGRVGLIGLGGRDTTAGGFGEGQWWRCSTTRK